MEQFRQMGEVLGSIKSLMIFQDEIQINQHQCSLLVDAYSLAFDVVAEEMRQKLRLEEKFSKWNSLENPLRELHRIFKEGEHYLRQYLETKDWWAKAILLNQSTDCIDFHLHNLLWCIPVVLEAIEGVGEISGCDHEEIQQNKVMFTKKYVREWMDPVLFMHRFGKQYLLSKEMCGRLDRAWKEDRWILTGMISEKKSSGSTTMTKQENQLVDLLLAPNGKMFPSSVLVGSKDYQVRRRLGNGSQYKEIQWMGEGFAIRHFFGEIEPFMHEISLLSSVRHANVLQIMYAFHDEERKECFLVMELMHKDLFSYSKETCSPRRKIPFPLLVAVDMMLQIARGMEYLHSCNIYHGDLNPSNILVKSRNATSDGYLHAKITGFGLSGVRNLRASMNQAATDPRIWHAPEVLSEQEQSPDTNVPRCTEKADVYSFAMICFQLLTGKIPFEDDHLQGDKMSRNVRVGARPLFPYPIPKYLINLTRRCWLADPSQRPSFSSICRVLRYIKRFLVMNPDHSQPNLPAPPVDYFDLEMSLSKRFTTWATVEALKVSEIPFQMFAYRVIERERTTLNFKERSSESGSEGTSIGGDENGLNFVIPEDSFPSTVGSLKSSCSQAASDNNKKASVKKMDGKAKLHLGQYHNRKAVRPPNRALSGPILRLSSECQLQTVMSPSGRRRSSGHASDSELA